MDVDYLPGWTEMGVTYRELVEMPQGQFRLLAIVVARCQREDLCVEDSVEQIKWALNRQTGT